MNSGVLDKWCFAFPVSARSAVAQQIKALATPGPSSAVFFAAYLVSEAQGVALESIWKSPLQKTCLENVKAAINFHCFIHHDHVQVTLGQTCNYPNVYAKNLEHVEYFVGTHTLSTSIGECFIFLFYFGIAFFSLFQPSDMFATGPCSLCCKVHGFGLAKQRC